MWVFNRVDYKVVFITACWGLSIVRGIMLLTYGVLYFSMDFRVGVGLTSS